MACSGLTTAAITLPLPAAELLSFPASPLRRAGSAGPDDPALIGTVPLHAQRHGGRHGGTLLLSKAACKRCCADCLWIGI